MDIGLTDPIPVETLVTETTLSMHNMRQWESKKTWGIQFLKIIRFRRWFHFQVYLLWDTRADTGTSHMHEKFFVLFSFFSWVYSPYLCGYFFSLIIRSYINYAQEECWSVIPLNGGHCERIVNTDIAGWMVCEQVLL